MTVEFPSHPYHHIHGRAWRRASSRIQALGRFGVFLYLTRSGRFENLCRYPPPARPDCSSAAFDWSMHIWSVQKELFQTQANLSRALQKFSVMLSVCPLQVMLLEEAGWLHMYDTVGYSSFTGRYLDSRRPDIRSSPDWSALELRTKIRISERLVLRWRDW